MIFFDNNHVETRLIASLREWKNPVVVSCFGILTGVTFYFQNIEFQFLIGLCLTILTYFFFSKNKKVLLLFLALISGYLYTQTYFKLLITNLDSLLNEKYIYIGEISSESTDYDYCKKYELNLKSATSLGKNKRWLLNDCKVEVTGSKYEEYEIGDIIQLTGRLKHPKNAILPGLFDERKFLLGKNINYILQADKGSLVYLQESKKYALLKKISRVRKEFLEINSSFLSGDKLSLVNGIIFGSKASKLDKALNEKVQSLGLSHITSASGFNVSILAAGIFCLFNLFNYRRKIIPTIISIFIVLFYSALADFSPSIIRATIFILFLLVGNLFDKKIKAIPAISLIILGFFIFNPASLLDIGLQLSILGFLGLDLFTSKTNNKNKNWLADTLQQTLFAQIMVLPLIALYFHNIQILGLISNLAAIPLASIILTGGLLNIIFFQIPGINFIIQKILSYSSGLFISWVNYLNHFTFKQIHLPGLNFYLVLLIYVLIVFLLSALFIKLSKTKIVAWVFIILSATVITYHLTDTNRYFKIHFLQAYNQDSILIVPPGEKIIFLSTKPLKSEHIQKYIMLNNNSLNTIYYNLKTNTKSDFQSKYVKNENDRIKVNHKTLSLEIIKNYNKPINTTAQYLKIPILNKKDPDLSQVLSNLPDTIIINDYKKLSKKSKKDIAWLKSQPCKSYFLSETGTITLVSDGKKTKIITLNY